MDNNRIRIFLGVNYSTVHGENVYVAGNIPELGSWDPSKAFPLNYHHGANWSNALEIQHSTENIEYKYIVLNTVTKEVRWEEGENRILDLNTVKSTKSELFNIESWNHREVNIRLKYDCSSKKILAICGEGVALGNWKNPVRMVLVNKKDPVVGSKITFWEKKFFVRHDVKRIKYRFVLLDDEEDTITWEREPDRVCDFVNLTTLSPYKRFESHPNKKDCLKFARKNNRFVKHDCNFVSEMCYDSITDHITIGPYPQNRLEIEILAKMGIRAVLNLQTRSDMKHRCLDWEDLKRNYRENRIKVVNFSIVDMSAEDIKFKAYDGANILHSLVKKYEKVYVHCTAGIWRAPHITAAYLHYYQEQAIEEAVKLIKEKRPFVYLSKELLQRAYNLYEKRMKTVGLYFQNGDTPSRNDGDVLNGITDENIAKNKIVGADNNKGYQFANTLMEVRCSSGRNL